MSLPSIVRRTLDQPLRRLYGLPESLRIRFSPSIGFDKPVLYYGFPKLPKTTDRSSGGITKFQLLETDYPNTPNAFNMLYMVSSRMPFSAELLVAAARRKGAKFIWNQNGVAYPAWHPQPGWKELNKRMAHLLHQADHVFYQSEFCRKSADHFLGLRHGPSEILYNSVDTEHFSPAPFDPTPERLTLLLAGTQMQAYRVQVALKTLVKLRSSYDAKLLIAGDLTWSSSKRRTRKSSAISCKWD